MSFFSFFLLGPYFSYAQLLNTETPYIIITIKFLPPSIPMSIPEHPNEGQRVPGHQYARLCVAEDAQLLARALPPTHVQSVHARTTDGK